MKDHARKHLKMCLSLPSAESVTRYTLLGEKLSLNAMYEFESEIKWMRKNIKENI
jgi:hypothetical protein